MACAIAGELQPTPTGMLANVSGTNRKNIDPVENIEGYMVGAAGLEPATLSFEG